MDDSTLLLWLVALSVAWAVGGLYSILLTVALLRANAKLDAILDQQRVATEVQRQLADRLPPPRRRAGPGATVSIGTVAADRDAYLQSTHTEAAR